MKTKAIIFDMDGTTVNTLEGIMYAMNCVLEEAHFPTHDLEAYKHFIGNGLKVLVSKALPKSNQTEEEIAKYLKLMIDSYDKNWEYNLHLYNGMPQLLDQLTSRGIKLAINTNKIDHIAKLIVDKYFSEWDISCVIGDRSDVPKKPDPTGPIMIMNELGVTPKECIYVGDSEVDVQTAINARLKVVGVAWGFRERDKLVDANYIIESPLELLDILDSIE
jgi:phosphoglycolate phosphatase